MFSKKKHTVTARGNSVIKPLIKKKMSVSSMHLENKMLERPCIFLKKNRQSDERIRVQFDLVSQPEVRVASQVDNSSMIGFRNNGWGNILLEEPIDFLRALTSIDISNSTLPIDDLLPIIYARLPLELKEVFGRVERSDISDVYSDMVCMDITLLDPDVSPKCRAWAKAEDWLNYFKHNNIKFHGINNELHSGCQLPIPCRIGEIDISAKQWQSLEVGDIIFLDRASFDAQGKGSVEILGHSHSLKYSSSDHSTPVLEVLS